MLLMIFGTGLLRSESAIVVGILIHVHHVDERRIIFFDFDVIRIDLLLWDRRSSRGCCSGVRNRSCTTDWNINICKIVTVAVISAAVDEVVGA